jgi:hypothetical protein
MRAPAAGRAFGSSSSNALSKADSKGTRTPRLTQEDDN